MLSLFDKWTLHCFGFQLRVFQTVCCTEAVIDADFACFAWGMSGSFIDIDSGHDNHKQKYYQHSSVQAEFNLRFLPVTKCFSRRYTCGMIPLIYIKYKNMMQRIYILHHCVWIMQNRCFSWRSASQRSGRGRKSGDSTGTRREEKRQKKERCSNLAEIRQVLASFGRPSNPNHNPLNHLRRSSKCGAHTPGTTLSYA